MADDQFLIELTAEVVAAYVAHNPIPAASLPVLIADVNAAIRTLGGPIAPPEPLELVPAVSPKRSVFPDYLISLEDGRKFKSLKRHLMSNYNLTPEQYRAKWNLPKDYPMVAPNYAARRSELAMSIGLGRKSAPPQLTPAPKKHAKRVNKA